MKSGQRLFPGTVQCVGTTMNMTGPKSSELSLREPTSMNSAATACCETNWVDWFDQTLVEVLGQCENTPKERTENRRRSSSFQDFSRSHDELLESLLHEQMILKTESDSTIPTSLSSLNSEDQQSLPPQYPRTKKARLGTKRALNELKRTNSNCSLTVTSTDLRASSFLSPETFLHRNCRLQKDKGKGEPVGASICAKGQDECLEKLRAKMKVLANVAFGQEKSTAATMKRRKARVVEVNEDYVETRSLIELKMGFLSMLYGVLARWDLVTGQAMIVVLRKNCSDAFYLSSPPRPARSRSHIEACMRYEELCTGKSAFYQRLSTVDLDELQPPFVVSKPITEPARLSVAIRRANCGRQRSNYTVVLKYGKRKTTILLTWDKQRQYMIPTLGESLTCSVDTEESLNPSCIEVRVFEQRLMRRKSQRMLVTSIDLPVTCLTPQSRMDARPVVVSVPFSKEDTSSSIDLELEYVSDYLVWLDSEIDSRKRYGVGRSTVIEDEEEPSSVWDWVLCVC